MRLAKYGDPRSRFEPQSTPTEEDEDEPKPLLSLPIRSDDVHGRINPPASLAQTQPQLPSEPLPMLPKRHHSTGPRLRRGLSIQHIPHKGEEWRWLNVVSFLVASSFIIGALLFISGGIAACLANPWVRSLTGWRIGEWKEIILVNYNYLTGHLYFVAGAYLGYFLVINVGQDERRLWAGPSKGTSISGYWGALLYFLGTLPFQISTTMMVVSPEASGSAKVFLTWLPQAIGGVFYTAGAVIEAIHNRGATWRQRVFWLCAVCTR